MKKLGDKWQEEKLGAMDLTVSPKKPRLWKFLQLFKLAQARGPSFALVRSYSVSGQL